VVGGRTIYRKLFCNVRRDLSPHNLTKNFSIEMLLLYAFPPPPN